MTTRPARSSWRRSLARRRFGTEAAAIGKTMMIEGETHQIVGVMPDAFRFPYVDASHVIDAAKSSVRALGGPRPASEYPANQNGPRRRPIEGGRHAGGRAGRDERDRAPARRGESGHERRARHRARAVGRGRRRAGAAAAVHSAGRRGSRAARRVRERRQSACSCEGRRVRASLPCGPPSAPDAGVWCVSC